MEHDWELPADIMERKPHQLQPHMKCRRCGYLSGEFYAWRWQDAVEHQTLNNPDTWRDIDNPERIYPRLFTCPHPK